MSNLPVPQFSVSITHHAELSADSSDIYVSVRGSSLFTGDVAFKKAREVGQLVTELKGVGLDEQHIKLVSIRSENAANAFSKSSSVLYNLRIHCTRLELLADILGAITSQKNAEIKRLLWQFPDTQEVEERLIDQCIQDAERKAKRIADGLNVRLTGIATVKETSNIDQFDRNSYIEQRDRLNFGRTRASRIDEETFGMSLSHSRMISITIEVTYLISNFIDGT